MKLRTIKSMLGILALSAAVPACGDDDNASTDKAEEDSGTKDSDKTTTKDNKDASNDTDTSDESSSGGSSSSTGSEPQDASNGDNTVDGEDGGAVDASSTNSDTNAVDTDGGNTAVDAYVPPPPECPELEDRTLVEVDEEISQDTEWTCDNLYYFPSGVLSVVTNGATLTIQPGVEVWGEEASGLVISRGSKIDANGQPNAPIVFTSSKEPGQRGTGDWGGVLLLGAARINDEGGEVAAEGVPNGAGYALFGGSDDTHDCGSMSYVRIEFAGYQVSPDNELNGLGIAGCGSETVLHHIQAHRVNDDGFEFWGGMPEAHHLVSSMNTDDALDWTSGYRGNLQFVVIQQMASLGDNGVEADNNEFGVTAEPRAMPTIYNLTMIGGKANGIVLRYGSWGRFYNAIITGYPESAVDLREAESIAGTSGNNPAITIENSLFYDNRDDGEHFGEAAVDGDDDDGFDEKAYFSDASRNNVFGVDALLGDPTNPTAPDFVPAAESPAAEGAATPPAGFDTTATYKGAFAPGVAPWTEGWTAFPEN